jgi:hypothetical protein
MGHWTRLNELRNRFFGASPVPVEAPDAPSNRHQAGPHDRLATVVTGSTPSRSPPASRTALVNRW